MERFDHYLARLVSLAVFAFAPEVVVLGTIAAAAGEALCFEPVRRQVAAHTWPHVARDLRILPAALGPERAAYAALAAAWEGARV
jgi:predicted NBD/HSP70 family sugar kinase